MGACYDVVAKIKCNNEAAAVGVVKKFMEEKETKGLANFRLDQYAEKEIFPTSIDGLMRIFLAGDKGNFSTTEDANGFVCYQSSFNASYGWEGIMIGVFHALSQHLAIGSTFMIYPDEDYDELIVKEEGCIQLH